MEKGLSDWQWVSFLLGEEVFAYDISAVREIIPYQEPVPVPGSPCDVEGILNVRGEIIPVLSGAKLVGAINQQSCDRIIILDSPVGMLGVTVESVGEIFRINQKDIELDSGQSKVIKGTVLHKDNLVILVELPDQPQAY